MKKMLAAIEKGYEEATNKFFEEYYASKEETTETEVTTAVE